MKGFSPSRGDRLAVEPYRPVARSARPLLRNPVEASRMRAHPADAFCPESRPGRDPGPQPRHPGNVNPVLDTGPPAEPGVHHNEMTPQKGIPANSRNFSKRKGKWIWLYLGVNAHQLIINSLMLVKEIGQPGQAREASGRPIAPHRRLREPFHLAVVSDVTVIQSGSRLEEKDGRARRGGHE
jgi:hypothetical protein